MSFSLTKLADVEISNIGTTNEGNLQNKDNLIIVQDGLIKQARASQISLNQIKIGEIFVGNVSSIYDNYISVRSGLNVDKGLTICEQTHLKGSLTADGESAFNEKLTANKGAEITGSLVVTGTATINDISTEKFENIDNKTMDLTDANIVESNKINYPTAFAVKKYVDDSIDESNKKTPYTTLTNNSNNLRINLYNVDNYQDYRLILMTMCRRKGNRHGEWYKIDEHSPTGNRQPTYGSLIGKKVHAVPPAPLYQAAPAWMPNGGYLQTEIELTDTPFVNIDISQYFLPILKPPLKADTFTTYKVDKDNSPLQYATIIGVNQRTKAPKLFKFCLQRISNGEIFQCKNILRIGGRYLKDLTSTEVVDTGNGQTVEKTKKYFGVTVKIDKSDPTKAYIQNMYKSIISI